MLWNCGQFPQKNSWKRGDVGLIPWVPLTDFADPPETMLRRCRAAIEEHAPPGEKVNLLAETQVFSFLRYKDLALLTVLGGKEVMLEVPFLDEIAMEKTREGGTAHLLVMGGGKQRGSPWGDVRPYRAARGTNSTEGRTQRQAIRNAGTADKVSRATPNEATPVNSLVAGVGRTSGTANK